MRPRERLIHLTGWLATVQGHAQWMLGLIFMVLPFSSHSKLGLQSIQPTLVFLLGSLISLLIGYLMRHPREEWMKWLFLFIAFYVPVEFWQVLLIEKMMFNQRNSLTFEIWKGHSVFLVGWPTWLAFALLLYFVPKWLPDESNRIETTRGRYNVLWLLITILIVGIVMTIAGSPLAFLEPISLLAIVVTLPFVLFLSGMEPSELPSFLGGLVWIKFIPADRVDEFRFFSRRAGRFVVLMGALTSLIGLVVMLGNLDSPDMLGPSMAVALLSLVYGLALKLLLFDPYCSILKYVEASSNHE